MKTRKILIIVILFFVVMLSTSCKSCIKTEEAQNVIDELFNNVVNNNFDQANKLLHPSNQINLEDYFDNLEKEYNVDFQKGIIREKYTGFESSLYDGEYNGAKFCYEMDLTIDNKAGFFASVTIVKNKQGFGIYEIYIFL